jgi:hypothetical protein
MNVSSKLRQRCGLVATCCGALLALLFCLPCAAATICGEAHRSLAFTVSFFGALDNAVEIVDPASGTVLKKFASAAAPTATAPSASAVQRWSSPPLEDAVCLEVRGSYKPSGEGRPWAPSKVSQAGMAIDFRCGQDDQQSGARVEARVASPAAASGLGGLLGQMNSAVIGNAARTIPGLGGGAPQSSPPSPTPVPAKVESAGPARNDEGKREKKMAKPPSELAHAGADDEAIPQFPVTPPAASAATQVARRLLLGSLREATLGEVADRLEAALRAAGYAELAYYGFPGGYAVVTQLERIRSDGRPLETDRWSRKQGRPRVWDVTFSDYLKALFNAPVGSYRVIALILSPHPFSEDPGKSLSDEEAANWLKTGLNKLPDSLRVLPYADNFVCTALIYEFELPARNAQARIALPSNLSGDQHLAAAQILAQLRTVP